MSAFPFDDMGCLQVHTTRFTLANNEQDQHRQEVPVHSPLKIMIYYLDANPQVLSGDSIRFTRATYARINTLHGPSAVLQITGNFPLLKRRHLSVDHVITHWLSTTHPLVTNDEFSLSNDKAPLRSYSALNISGQNYLYSILRGDKAHHDLTKVFC